MTSETRQLLQRNQYGNAYIELGRSNYQQFGGDELTPGPADVAHDILDKSLNKPTLLPRQKGYRLESRNEDNPISCFEVGNLAVKSVVKSIAAQAISEYGHGEVGFIDMNDAVSTSERSKNTTSRIQALGRTTVAAHRGVTLIAVEAGNNLDETEQIAASEIYNSLASLSSQNFRVAVLGTSDIS